MSDQLFAERHQKFALWEELGFAPYGGKFERTHISSVATEYLIENKPKEVKEILASPQKNVSMAGRIVNFRDMGKMAFIKIRDAEGDFQICLMEKILGDTYKKLIKALDLADFCGFTGDFFLTKHGEPTLLAFDVTPLAKALRPLPEKFHGLTNKEAQYRQRYLDLISNKETFDRFMVRTKVINEIRNFLNEKSFQEVETRILQPQAGGAMAKVFETHHNALDHEFVLRISLELDLKMLVAGGMERVYEIGKCFRNEGIDPSHLQEFTLLEWYAAYADLEDNMNWTEKMIKSVMDKTVQTHKITVLDKENKEHEVDFGGEWKRVSFPDLLKEYAGLDMFTATIDEIRNLAVQHGMTQEEVHSTSRGNLLDHIYKKTARPTLIQPTFVMNYPSELKPLARPKEDGTAECYQLLVAGWEIVNSYGELIDPIVQRKLLEEQAASREAGDDEAMQVDEVFLRSMEHGMPPMTGFGMGIDRFVALITGQPNLRDVVLFPQMKPEEKHTD